MKKLLIYYNFIVVSLMVIVGFVTATSYINLAVAVLFYPLLIYFSSKVLPRRTRAINLPTVKTVKTEEAKGEIVKEKDKKADPEVLELKKEGVDIDRRMFLKLIGSAGISMFLFSLFTKKAEAAFFGSAPGPGIVAIKDSTGTTINPAEKQPTDGYRISRLDDATPSYYGFTNKDGAWFIMKELADGSYLYVRGDSGFTSSWALRDDPGTSYGEYENVF